MYKLCVNKHYLILGLTSILTWLVRDRIIQGLYQKNQRKLFCIIRHQIYMINRSDKQLGVGSALAQFGALNVQVGLWRRKSFKNIPILMTAPFLFLLLSCPIPFLFQSQPFFFLLSCLFLQIPPSLFLYLWDTVIATHTKNIFDYNMREWRSYTIYSSRQSNDIIKRLGTL